MENYNGWTNWDTWNTYNWIVSYEEIYRKACEMDSESKLKSIFGEWVKTVDDNINPSKVNWKELFDGLR